MGDCKESNIVLNLERTYALRHYNIAIVRVNTVITLGWVTIIESVTY